MQKTIVFELEQSKKRLNYFNLIKEKNGPSLSVSKWIQIYSERTTRLEKKVKELSKPGS